MAKLSARGRTEIWRMRRNGEVLEDGRHCTHTYALMSDGTLLSKSSWYVSGRLDHTTGWSVSQRSKNAERQAEWRKRLNESGYREVRS